MIVEKSVIPLILNICLLNGAIGASYSNVYVERETAPVRYYHHGAPYTLSSVANPQFAQIKTLSSSVPAFVTPCVSPCSISEQTVAELPANVLTYNSPYANVPVVIAPRKEEATGYEYSYVVYDENTGDHKAQRELSDGSVVRGEYSFLQPDGYVREVKYVADDLNGFNAVVKNFLPVALAIKPKVEVKKGKEPTVPCHETQKESIKEISIEETEETEHGQEQSQKSAHNHEPKHGLEHSSQVQLVHEHSHDQHSEENHEQSNETVYSKEHGHGDSSDLKHSQEHVHEPEHLQVSEHSHEHEYEHDKHDHELANGHIPVHVHVTQYSHGGHGQGSKEHSNEILKESSNKSEEKQSMESQVKIEEKEKKKLTNPMSEESQKESEEKSKEKHGKKHKKDSEEESHEKHEKKSRKESHEETEEESTETNHKMSEAGHKKHNIKSKQKSEAESDESEEGSSKERPVMIGLIDRMIGKRKGGHELMLPEPEMLVPYHDVIRCVEAALKRAQEKPAELKEQPSPLTYIVLNNPC